MLELADEFKVTITNVFKELKETWQEWKEIFPSQVGNIWKNYVQTFPNFDGKQSADPQISINCKYDKNKSIYPRYIGVKLLKAKDKSKILKTAREKQLNTYRGTIAALKLTSHWGHRPEETRKLSAKDFTASKTIPQKRRQEKDVPRFIKAENLFQADLASRKSYMIYYQLKGNDIRK